MVLAALGTVIGACLLLAARLGPLREHLSAFMGLYTLAFVAYVGAVWMVVRRPNLASGRALWAVLGAALAYRLMLLPAAPTLSDDLFRYVWEGRVVLAGQSPYRLPPNAPSLIPLRDQTIWPFINNRDVPSPYPPLAQLGGVLAAALWPHSPYGMKLVSTLADVGVIAAVLALLRATETPAGHVLVYAWHPSTAVEFAHSGHNDSLMLLPMTLALALAAGGRRWTPALLVGLAALAKVSPLLLLPLLPRKLGLVPALLAGGVFALGWVPFLVLGGGQLGSITAYLGSWKDNDSIHAVLHALLGAELAKPVSLALLLAGVAGVALHPALRDRPLWWQAYAVLALAIASASTVHTWYLTWLLPMLAVVLAATGRLPFLGPPAALGWLVFSGLATLPYLTYDTFEWRLWISFAQYVPLYACLLWALWHDRAMLARWAPATVRGEASVPAAPAAPAAGREAAPPGRSPSDLHVT